MSKFELYNEENAPEKSRPLLTGVKKAFGMVPNLFAAMAESPVMLEGYIALNAIIDKADLSETEKQIIFMTNSHFNGCEYCMAAHTSVSQGAKVPADVIESLRSGTPIADPKLEALRQFTIVLNEKRGWAEEADIDALLNAGYKRETVLEVITGTSFKIMSNYLNHIVKAPIDTPFQANKWSKG